MSQKIRILIYFLAIATPYLIVFKAFFLTGTLSWGDAPFFYNENLKELFNKPLIWNDRNDNFGTSQGEILWLYLPTFLYGALHYLFGFSNNFLVRIVFYLPATILALASSWIFLGLYVKKTSLKFLGSFLYTFNTYFLLIIDGGQIGVGLAYGLFPFVVWTVINFFHKGNFKNYLLSLAGIFLLSNIDIRIFILAFLLSFFLLLGDFIFRKDLYEINSLIFSSILKKIFILFTPLFFLNYYWLISLFFINNPRLTNFLSISDKSLVTLVNSLFLFQPHFPLNEFGNLNQTPFYFVFIITLLFIGFLFPWSRIYLYLSILFLLFAFFAKGSSQPFGQLYEFMIRNIPYGVAFRDSSKFYFSLMLIASTILVISLENLTKNLKRKETSSLIIFIVYIYLLVLINPALLGKLNGVLAGGNSLENYKIIYDNLNSSSDFYRSLWFNNRPQVAFSSWRKPAISASTLYREIPFASMIEGDYDLFYFLHDPLLADWFNLLGIKYVFFPEDDRKKVVTREDNENRVIFLNFIDKINGFQRLDWSVSFPSYKIQNTKDHIFTQNLAFIILGDGGIYDFIKSLNLDITSYGFIVLEDGLVNPNMLLNLPSSSAVMLLRDRSWELDLPMTFLKSLFLDFTLKNTITNWGIYEINNYLKVKNEFLKNGIRTKDLLFGKSVIFSSVKDEQISIKHKIKESGNYYLALRTISATDSTGLKVKVAKFDKDILPSTHNFKWELIGPFVANVGTQEILIKNAGGFNAINIIALINEKELNTAYSKSKLLKNNLSAYNLDNKSEVNSFKKLLSTNSNSTITYSQIDPTEYSIKSSAKSSFWLVFSDHYNEGWQLNNAIHFPFYSMINGYWVENAGEDLVLKYIPQDKINFAAKISFISGLILISILICYSSKERIKK